MSQPSSRGAGRRRRRRWRTWALAASLTAAVAVVTVASAAQLPVFSPDHQTASATPCTTLTLPTAFAGTMTAGNYTQVQISGIPAACNDLTVNLVVYGAAGLQLATGTGTTGATGTATITTTSYRGVSAKGVALLVNTWGVRTTWTAPPYYTCIATNNQWVPIVPTVNCTLANETFTLGTHRGYQTMTMSFQVEDLGGRNRFILTVDFAAAPPFPGWTPVRLWQNNLRADPSYSCTQLPFVSVRGRTSDGPTYYFYETLDPQNFNPGGYTRICP